MKKGIWLMTATVLAGASAWALGSLITSFEVTTPGFAIENINALGYVDTSHLCGTNYFACFTASSATGDVTKLFYPQPLVNHDAEACDYGHINGARGTFLWGGHPYNGNAGSYGYIFRSTLDGSVLGSYHAPLPGFILGITFRAGARSDYLILAQHRPGYPESLLYRLNPLTGEVYASYNVDGQIRDMAHDGARYCYWAAGKFPFWSSNAVVGYLNYEGHLIGSFVCAEDNDSPYGVAYDPVSRYLYVSNYYSTMANPSHAVFVYETEMGDGGSGIRPASLGRVKAVFR